jgi:UDP-glucose 4-epimerase
VLIDETAPTVPVNPYGHSKLASEFMLKDIARVSGMRATILRYFNVAGADPKLRTGLRTEFATHLIKVSAEVAAGKRPYLSIFGTDYATHDGTCVRDYIHVHDLARAHLRAVQHLRNGGDSRKYNLGNGKGFSIKDVIDVVSKVTGKPVPFEMADRRPGDPATLVGGSGKIKGDWGWEPIYGDLETIVEHAWNWHRTHPDGYDTVSE